ncbi:hypothetical protein SK143_0048 [Streptococcus oralis]|uniref:Uncharacterized protein n=1 Tax=Streptococcus oralis TaxID=1303 RepID=A0A081R7N3_STROR|nr:hypothetical protein SK143_0048 [Streptococcus oralis]
MFKQSPTFSKKHRDNNCQQSSRFLAFAFLEKEKFISIIA